MNSPFISRKLTSLKIRVSYRRMPSLRNFICIVVLAPILAACKSTYSEKNLTNEPPPILRSNSRIYVACQTSDDFSYVVEYAGEDNLIVGTDYGHADYSNDIEAIQTLARGGKISASLARKILVDNPKRLYGL